MFQKCFDQKVFFFFPFSQKIVIFSKFWCQKLILWLISILEMYTFSYIMVKVTALPIFQIFWVDTNLKGTLTNFSPLLKNSKFEFFAPIYSFSPRRTFPQRNLADIVSLWNKSIFSINARVWELILHSSLWRGNSAHNHA